MSESGGAEKMIEPKLKTRSVEVVASAGGFKIAGLRWWIIGLIFFATLINYVDRLTISVLAPVITRELGLSNLEFASVATWFLVAYTISQTLSGKLYDRVGTRKGFTISVIVWSSAAMAHTFARGLASLSLFRFALGLGEAGNWPGAAKAIAEWFPVKQRAFAMAIFNSGAALGSVIAPPLIVWLQLRYGWQATFIVTGALGLIWLGAWLVLYRAPESHPWISDEELRLIREDAAGPESATARSVAAQKGLLTPRWRDLLRCRQVWAIVLARFFVDPIWWLYITWLPKYLADVRGFSLAQIGYFAWVPYVAADVGSLFGGWMAGHLIGRGWSVGSARRAVIVGAALLMPAGMLAAFASRPLEALVLIAAVLFGFQAWINNVQTLPSDLFPSRAVASVAGLGGTGAGIGAILFTLSTGWVVDHFSYTPVLVIAGLLAPLGTFALFALTGPIGPVALDRVLPRSSRREEMI
jgi:ACS family hexuronate transporter-like MFS transporter